MAQNTGRPPDPRRRGRPPSYDRDEALARTGDAFWKTGYAATTVDDLATAAGMNRPSLYNAFGDKHTLYLEVLDRYARASVDKLESLLDQDRPLARQLMAAYDGALAIYLAGDGAPKGCFLIGTAVSEAVDDAVVRDALLDALKRLDHAFERRFVRAREAGEIGRDADPRALAQVACAVMNGLAVRARAGEPRESLRRTARQAVECLAR